jgi:N-acetylmuramoyl-L-alanine amidase
VAKQKVGSGESTASLAKKKGFFWRTIWDHPENADLRAKRKDPSVLFADDDIFFPEKQLKEVSKSTDAEHTFKRKGEPCKIKLQLLKLGKPRANEDYVINIEGTLIEGKTDAEGNIEHFMPGEAKSGKLILRGGKEEYPLKIGYLDPLEKVVGVQQRLNNLGYNCSESNKLDEKMKDALKKFQADNKLEASGEIDSATKSKLEQLSK